MSKKLLILSHKTVDQYGLQFLKSYLTYDLYSDIVIVHDEEKSTYNGVYVDNAFRKKSDAFVIGETAKLKSTNITGLVQNVRFGLDANPAVHPIFKYTSSSDTHGLFLHVTNFFKDVDGIDEIIIDNDRFEISKGRHAIIEEEVKFLHAYLDFKPKITFKRQQFTQMNEINLGDVISLLIGVRADVIEVRKHQVAAMINVINGFDTIKGFDKQTKWFRQAFFPNGFTDISNDLIDTMVEKSGEDELTFLKRFTGFTLRPFTVPGFSYKRSKKNVINFMERFLILYPKVTTLKVLEELMLVLRCNKVTKGCGEILNIPTDMNDSLVKILNRHQKKEFTTNYLETIIATFGDNFTWNDLDAELMKRSFPDGITIGKYTFGPDGKGIAKYKKAKENVIDVMLRNIFNLDTPETRKLIFMLLAIYTDEEFESNMLKIAEIFTNYVTVSKDLESIYTLVDYSRFINDDVKTLRKLRPETAERYDERIKIIMEKLTKDIRKLNNDVCYAKLSVFVETHSLQDYFDESIFGKEFKKAVFENKLK